MPFTSKQASNFPLTRGKRIRSNNGVRIAIHHKAIHAIWVHKTKTTAKMFVHFFKHAHFLIGEITMLF